MWQFVPSLRFRLAAINFSATAIILLIVCGTILVARSRELQADLDERLIEQAQTSLAEYVTHASTDGSTPPQSACT